MCVEYRMTRSNANIQNGNKRESTPGLSKRGTVMQALGYTDDETTETLKRGW